MTSLLLGFLIRQVKNHSTAIVCSGYEAWVNVHEALQTLSCQEMFAIIITFIPPFQRGCLESVRFSGWG